MRTPNPVLHATLLSVAVLAAVFSVMAGPSALSLARSAKAGSTIVLCAPASTVTEHQMKRSLVTISRRVRHGFHFKQAIVSLNGNCLTVTLTRPLKWVRWLATDLSSQGHFGIGVAYPNAKKALIAGELVRYRTDPVTSANSSLPVVQIAIGRPSFVGYSARLVTRQGYEYVGVRLKPKGAQALCSFTQRVQGGLAVVVLDRRIITDEQVTVKICGGKLLTGFPRTKSLDVPLGPRELVADLHSGPALPVPFTYSIQG